jgi:pSer/pThr/pTyr-binding forkhead associated (FHA) protein
MRLGRSSAGQEIACPGCRAPIRLVGEISLATADEPLCRLQINEGPVGSGRQFFLSGHKDIEVGKLHTKTVHLESGLVSRNHCRLVRHGADWTVEDQNSTNGLYINGQRIKERVLREGDKLQIGDFALTFHVAPASAATADNIAQRRLHMKQVAEH